MTGIMDEVRLSRSCRRLDLQICRSPAFMAVFCRHTKRYVWCDSEPCLMQQPTTTLPTVGFSRCRSSRKRRQPCRDRTVPLYQDPGVVTSAHRTIRRSTPSLPVATWVAALSKLSRAQHQETRFKASTCQVRGSSNRNLVPCLSICRLIDCWMDLGS